MAQKPFEIGLVMAGAVSAGAYTAGVLDFLFEALDEWHREKGPPPVADVPPHAVRLKVMSGASAGGMCGAIAAVCLGEPFTPVRDPLTAAGGNRLFNAWVKQIDLLPLLETDDLDPDRPPLSALNGKVLDRIRADALGAPSGGAVIRRYVADPLHVLVTTTNLRGVPYHLSFQGGASQGVRPHYMMAHADFVHFEVAAPPSPLEFVPGAGPEPFKGVPVARTDMPNGPGWQLFGDAALATGAFPVGLPPRKISVPPAVYEDRRWRVLTSWEDQGTAFTASGDIRVITPDWEATPPPDPYSYVAVDGGTMDNEPVALARSLLPSNADSHSADGTKSALIMIDPFPDTGNPAADPAAKRFEGFSYAPPGKPAEWMNVGHLASRIIRSFIQQSRFKPGEIARADDPDVFDQYLVAPERPGRRADQSQIACGGMGGFAGFFDEAFRRHDYALGRHNAYLFLKYQFALPLYDAAAGGTARTALFANWSPAAIREHLVVWVKTPEGIDTPVVGDAARALVTGLDTPTPTPLDPAKHAIFLPVIPLRGSARTEPPLPAWPKLRADRTKKALRRRVKARLDAVVGRMITGMTGFFSRQALFLARLFKSGDVADQIMDMVAADLVKEGLVDPDWGESRGWFG